jgi:hypothetical protein
MRGRDDPTSRRGRSATIMIAVAMREEAEEVEAVVVTVLDARDVMSIFVRLGAALQAREREQANSGRARQRDDVLAHSGFLWSGVKALNVSG